MIESKERRLERKWLSSDSSPLERSLFDHRYLYNDFVELVFDFSILKDCVLF